MGYNFKAVSLPLAARSQSFLSRLTTIKHPVGGHCNLAPWHSSAKPFSDELLLHTIRSALRGQLEGRKNLISLVDDDESIRRTTTLLIESFGFHAAAFESAERFLKSEQLHKTSCLVIDVQMPGMNGLQLQSYLAAAGCKIPVIFITAHDNKESRQQAMQAGAVAFLGKPFSDELLLHAIRGALRQDEGAAITK